MNKQEQDFRKLMKNYRGDRAPKDFSKRVMGEIYGLEKPVLRQPVFSKWFLTVMGLVFVFIVLTAVSVSPRPVGGGTSAQLDSLLEVATSWNSSFFKSASQLIAGFSNTISPLLLVVLFAFLMLLILDSFLQSRKNMVKK
ncbi:MAG: hypothetical protein ACK5JD_01975 [Mangrovibacterium sp.]